MARAFWRATDSAVRRASRSGCMPRFSWWRWSVRQAARASASVGWATERSRAVSKTSKVTSFALLRPGKRFRSSGPRMRLRSSRGNAATRFSFWGLTIFVLVRVFLFVGDGVAGTMDSELLHHWKLVREIVGPEHRPFRHQGKQERLCRWVSGLRACAWLLGENLGGR